MYIYYFNVSNIICIDIREAFHNVYVVCFSCAGGGCRWLYYIVSSVEFWDFAR